VESNEHAYSQIKRVQPDLVILCVRIDDMSGFQVLSMLKLDGDTRDIPVMTYTTDYEGRDAEEEAADVSETAMFTPRPAEVMN
jgi:CheY-like chemotaxis protein